MKKTAHFFLSLLTIAVLAVACSKKQGAARYYRRAYLDEKYEIKGKYPVAHKLVQKMSCYRFDLDSDGKVTKVAYLEGGNPAEDPYFGVANIEFEYPAGFKKMLFRDRDGKPARNRSGVHALLLKLNENNDPVYLFHFDMEGLVTENNHGVAQYSWSLDEKGRKSKAILLDVRGMRIMDRNGYYELRYTYDESGNIIEMANYGEDGQRLADKSGIAAIRQKFDDQRNVIEQKYFDAQGTLKENSEGVAILRMKYDSAGNRVEQRHYGTDGQLKDVKEGVAIWQMEYDEHGKLVKTVILDTKENRIKEYRHIHVEAEKE